MIPEGWTQRELAELCSLISRGKAPKYTPSLTVTGIYAINQKCVRNGVVDPRFGRPHHPDKAVPEEFCLKRDDICINSTGTGTIGRVGWWEGLNDGRYFPDTHITLLRVRREDVQPRFLAYLLQQDKTQKAISTECFSGSTNQVELNKGALSRLALTLPPLPEQRKIAAILSSVDDAIEKTQAVIEQVQVVKKGLMQELLTRGLPGRHTKFKQTEIGEVPEEWEVLRLQALGKGDGRPVLRTGPFGSSLKTEHFTDRGTPVLNIQCLGEGEILEDGLFYVDDQKAQELTEYRVAEGDLVFSRVADVGRSVVIPREAEGWIISSNLMRISPNPNVVDPHFLMYSIVGSGAVVRQIEGVTAKGGRAVVSSLILNGLVFPIPALEEQRVIASSLQAVEQRVRTERFHTQRLAGVKSALMSVLLTGEVRVTPDSEAA